MTECEHKQRGCRDCAYRQGAEKMRERAATAIEEDICAKEGLPLGEIAMARYCAEIVRDTPVERKENEVPRRLIDVRCRACAEPVRCPRGHTDGLMDVGHLPVHKENKGGDPK